MTSLIRLHSYYLLTKKTTILTTLFISIMICVLGLLARPFDSQTARIIYHSSYLLDYTIEGFALIKMALYVIGLYSVLHVSIMTPYDTVLIQRTHKGLYLLSKYITLWLYTTLIIGVLGLYYALISYLIFDQVHPMLSFNTASKGLILITLYTLLLYAVSLYSKHYLALILVMFSFFISDMLVSMHAGLHGVSSLGILANILAPNLHILTETTAGFIVPLRILLYLVILYIVLIVSTVLTSDN